MQLLLAYAAAAACMVAAALSWKFLLKHQNYMQGLCLGLSLSRFRLQREDTAIFFPWRNYSCEGQYQGRLIRLNYRFRSFPEQYRLPLRLKAAEELTLQIPVIQKFWLRLVPERVPAGPDEEVQIGVPVFDQDYLVHSNQPEAAREFLSIRLVQEQIRKLPLFDRLEFHRGALLMQIPSPAKANIRRSDLEKTLDALLLLATEYMQQSQNYAIRTLNKGGVVCPYCRCSLEDNEPALNCGFCGTCLHVSCWRENGQCTTWGCSSGIPGP